jgi:nucleotide-binding universal stress UspA family protein
VLRGRPAEAILEDAATFQADLLVLGTNAHGAVASLVLGSVAAQVVDRSPAPVLVARQRAISRVLFAIDQSSGASDAEDLLRTWPIFDGLAIRVVSASSTWSESIEGELETPGVDASAGDPAGAPSTRLEFAQQGAARLTAAGRKAHSVQRVGEPAEAIIRAAAEWNADLVVLGSSGRSSRARRLPRSVVRHVLHGSHASVFVARAPIGTRPSRVAGVSGRPG